MFGEIIKQERLKRGWTQKQVAEMINRPATYVSECERNGNPRLNDMGVFTKLFGWRLGFKGHKLGEWVEL